MPELPASWGLKTKRRNDGKLDIMGKDDSGNEYRVRTTDTPGITEKDVLELKKADRESYPNPNTRTREYVKWLTDNPQKEEREKQFEDDLIELAGPVVHAGLERGRPSVEMGSAYERGERYWKEVEEWRRRGCPLPTGEN